MIFFFHYTHVCSSWNFMKTYNQKSIQYTYNASSKTTIFKLRMLLSYLFYFRNWSIQLCFARLFETSKSPCFRRKEPGEITYLRLWQRSKRKITLLFLSLSLPGSHTQENAKHYSAFKGLLLLLNFSNFLKHNLDPKVPGNYCIKWKFHGKSA